MKVKIAAYNSKFHPLDMEDIDGNGFPQCAINWRQGDKFQSSTLSVYLLLLSSASATTAPGANSAQMQRY